MHVSQERKKKKQTKNERERKVLTEARNLRLEKKLVNFLRCRLDGSFLNICPVACNVLEILRLLSYFIRGWRRQGAKRL